MKAHKSTKTRTKAAKPVRKQRAPGHAETTRGAGRDIDADEVNDDVYDDDQDDDDTPMVSAPDLTHQERYNGN